MKSTDVSIVFDYKKNKEFFKINRLIQKNDYDFFVLFPKQDIIKYLILADSYKYKEDSVSDALKINDLNDIGNAAILIKKYKNIKGLFKLLLNEKEVPKQDFKRIVNKLSTDSTFDFAEELNIDFETNIFSKIEYSIFIRIFKNAMVRRNLQIILNLSDSYLNEIAYVTKLDENKNPTKALLYFTYINDRPIADKKLQFNYYADFKKIPETQYECFFYLMSNHISGAHYELIGNSLISILNNHKEIEELLNAFVLKIKKTLESQDLERFMSIYMLELAKLVIELNKITPYLCFTENLLHKYLINFLNKDGKINIEKFSSTIKECITYLTGLSYELKDYYEKLDKYTKNQLETMSLNLPVCSIYYDSNSSISLFQYEYKLFTIEDLLNISMYHVINKKIIINKCATCNKFFITNKKRDNKYCLNSNPDNPNFSCYALAHNSSTYLEELKCIEYAHKKAYNRIYMYIKREESKGDKKNPKKLNFLEDKMNQLKISYEEKKKLFENHKIDAKDLINWLNSVHKKN